jgi:adenylate cyclase
MSTDPEQEYFSDGLTEDIITALTHWRSFPVIARNSCFAYKNKSVDITQVARDLGARYLLEGSVRRGGVRVRVTAQLIDGANGHHIWAEQYDRELNDIFEVQDDIVQRIAALVAPELARAELKRSTSKQPQNLDAWDLCLRGMASIRERTAEGNAKARDLFTRAIAILPDYADAHAGLAMSYNQDILIEVAKGRTATATQAMEAARKAIECDESSSWAHHELSTAYQWLNRLDDALAEARIAVDLNPNNAYGLHALGNKSDLAGDPDGIVFMVKAQKLNPEDARLPTHLSFLARAYVNFSNHDAAVERARQAIRRRPDYVPAYFILAIALGHLGELDEARAALAKCDELSPDFVQSRKNWQPYADPASNERLQEGLRRIDG